jgi:pyridoxamine 5'-phosphate oxidase
MHIIEQLQADQAAANAHQDPNANLCFFSTVDPNGSPQVRTLVLRQIAETTITLFINTSSPKWQQLSEQPRCQALLWYPSLQIQYRLSGIAEALASDAIQDNWHKRPLRAKLLDYFYDWTAPQSSRMTSRAGLLEQFEALSQRLTPEDLKPSSAAIGLSVQLDQIERLDLSQNDLPHARTLFERSENGWTTHALVP